MWLAGLYHALRWSFILAPGYIFNDGAKWVGRVTGTGSDSNGKYPWWVGLVVVVVSGIALALLLGLLKMLFPKSAVK